MLVPFLDFEPPAVELFSAEVPRAPVVEARLQHWLQRCEAELQHVTGALATRSHAQLATLSGHLDRLEMAHRLVKRMEPILHAQGIGSGACALTQLVDVLELDNLREPLLSSLRREPPGGDDAFGFARLALACGDRDEAMRMTANQSSSDNARFRIALASWHWRHGDSAEAYELFDAVEESLAGADANVINGAIDLSLVMGNLRGARRVSTRLPQLGSTALKLARAHWDAGDEAACHKAVERACGDAKVGDCRSQPDDILPLYRLTLQQHHLGDPDGSALARDGAQRILADIPEVVMSGRRKSTWPRAVAHCLGAVLDCKMGDRDAVTNVVVTDNNVTTWAAYGDALIATGSYRRALDAVFHLSPIGQRKLRVLAHVGLGEDDATTRASPTCCSPVIFCRRGRRCE